MKLSSPEELPKLPNLKIAVIGHVEWVTFLTVDKCPKPGEISHGKIYLEEPAGGGAVTAIKIANLIDSPVHLFTALGKDPLGQKSYERMKEFGLKISVAWKDQPTRKGISMTDSEGERAITVIGDRLVPAQKDQLPWNELDNYDGVFVTATDSAGLQLCRKAKIVVGTPRIGISVVQRSGIKLDALISSAFDPQESSNATAIANSTELMINTKGDLGGEAFPGGHFDAMKLKEKVVDSYGCGDSFAAGVTTGLSAGWDIDKAISLGAHCGAKCATHLGPYSN